MYRKSSFTPSSFFGPRGALGSSFSSSFFFPPRSALSGFAGTGGPSGSGLGFSSGIDEIPGWDGHPNFTTYLRIRSARPEVRVFEDGSGVVHRDFDPIADSGMSSYRVRLDPRIEVPPAARGPQGGPFDPRSIEALPTDRPTRFGIAHRASATFRDLRIATAYSSYPADRENAWASVFFWPVSTTRWDAPRSRAVPSAYLTSREATPRRRASVSTNRSVSSA